MDSFATLKKDGVRRIMNDPNKYIYERALRFKFKISNNEVEYELLLSKLKLTQEFQV